MDECRKFEQAQTPFPFWRCIAHGHSLAWLQYVYYRSVGQYALGLTLYLRKGCHTPLGEHDDLRTGKSKLFCFSGQRLAADNVAAPTCGSSYHISRHWGLSSSRCSSILRCYSSPHCPSSPRGPHSKPCQHRREAFGCSCSSWWLMSQYTPIGVAYVYICVILVISQ